MNLKSFETNLENVKKLTPEVYKDSMNITIPFFILHRKIFEHGDKFLKKNFLLNQSELDILSTLYYKAENNFTMSPTDLYDVMFFSSGGMTKVLKKLEQKEYIRRIDNILDKRSKLVQLTNLGKDITKKSLKQIVELEDKYFDKLDKEEQKLLNKLLLKALS